MKYKRLTRRNEDGTSWVKCAVCDIQDKCDFTKESCCQELQDRLAELEDKIEQGLMIELPCKVGDKIYIVHNKPLTGWCFYKSHLHYYNMQRVLEEYGEFIFLTREEAEKRLKELQE